MVALTAESQESVTNLLNEATLSARYLTDQAGDKTDVVLPLDIWERLVIWLENLDDRAVVQAWVPRLRSGPVLSGALKWDDVAASWDNDEEL